LRHSSDPYSGYHPLLHRFLDATEPLLLGNKTTDLLSKLVINLKAWMTVASPLFASTPGGVAGLPTITSQLVGILSELETNLKQGTIKSKNNFTV
jgi:hypothetical protein